MDPASSEEAGFFVLRVGSESFWLKHINCGMELFHGCFDSHF